jgi:hypothetical protein
MATAPAGRKRDRVSQRPAVQKTGLRHMATGAGHATSLALLSEGVGAAVVVSLEQASGKSGIKKKLSSEFGSQGVVGEAVCSVRRRRRQELGREGRKDAMFRVAEFRCSRGVCFTGQSNQTTDQYLNSYQDTCLAQRQVRPYYEPLLLSAKTKYKASGASIRARCIAKYRC